MTSKEAMKTVKDEAKKFIRWNGERLFMVAPELRRAAFWYSLVGPGMVGMTAGKPGFSEWMDELATAFVDYTESNDFFTGF